MAKIAISGSSNLKDFYKIRNLAKMIAESKHEIVIPSEKNQMAEFFSKEYLGFGGKRILKNEKAASIIMLGKPEENLKEIAEKFSPKEKLKRPIYFVEGLSCENLTNPENENGFDIRKISEKDIGKIMKSFR